MASFVYPTTTTLIVECQQQQQQPDTFHVTCVCTAISLTLSGIKSREGKGIMSKRKMLCWPWTTCLGPNWVTGDKKGVKYSPWKCRWTHKSTEYAVWFHTKTLTIGHISAERETHGDCPYRSGESWPVFLLVGIPTTRLTGAAPIKKGRRGGGISFSPGSQRALQHTKMFLLHVYPLDRTAPGRI